MSSSKLEGCKNVLWRVIQLAETKFPFIIFPHLMGCCTLGKNFTTGPAKPPWRGGTQGRARSCRETLPTRWGTDGVHRGPNASGAKQPAHQRWANTKYPQAESHEVGETGTIARGNERSPRQREERARFWDLWGRAPAREWRRGWAGEEDEEAASIEADGNWAITVSQRREMSRGHAGTTSSTLPKSDPRANRLGLARYKGPFFSQAV